KIIIFDTTLRDGEQAPGASLISEQKLEIARQLESLGVDIIEAGFPVSSGEDFKAVKLVSSNIRKAVVCGLARCVRKDIESAYQSLRKAKHPRIHIFLATSKIHLKYKFRKPESEILEIAKKFTRFARKFCDDIEFSPEDATRSEKDFLFKVIETAIKEGASTINIPDTVGYSYPQEIYELISSILNNVSNINKAVLSIHCHDDLGMAVANSLSAVLAGVRQVHCTINGLGERAGNASLEEIVMAINTRRDVFGDFYTDINTKYIYKTSRLVSTLTGFLVPPNKAIVGKNAFRHEAGIHQDAVLKKRITYEIINPADVGIPSSQLVLGKHSGRHALLKRLLDLGFKVDKSKLQDIFKKFKDLADRKKEIFDEDLLALMEEETKSKKIVFELKSVKVNTGTEITPQATIRIKYKNKILESTSSGDGPVDACFKAIDKITHLKPKLLDFNLKAVTSGKDALGEANLTLSLKGKIFSARSSSTDIIEASVKAYLEALNKAFLK
ncbi:MAG: 2-isopropylmalate synthase, partial [Candidatus Omnitrophica bacterium]|nr:2-isopropylmalate synthase [Candidatus Omnitrophota bacterium]